MILDSLVFDLHLHTRYQSYYSQSHNNKACSCLWFQALFFKFNLYILADVGLLQMNRRRLSYFIGLLEVEAGRPEGVLELLLHLTPTQSDIGIEIVGQGCQLGVVGVQLVGSRCSRMSDW